MEDRASILRAMRICRFCLTENEPLTNMYGRENKNAIPLPLQIMACVAIEVFANDGMPQLICENCRLQTSKSYTFKTTCKQSDDALKLFLATGILHKRAKPVGSKKEEMNIQKRPTETDAPLSNKRQKTNVVREEENVNTVEVIAEADNQGLPYETATETTEGHCTADEVVPEQVKQEVPKRDTGEVESLQQDSKLIPKQVATQCFPCDHCERSFPLQQLLDIHMRQHTRERRYGCFECDKKFFSKHDLSKHIQTHTGEKPFVCVVCEKSFSRANLLHRHEKVHVSVPKYLCSYCDKTYISSEDLDVHMAIHKKKRPFKCNKCDKSFAFKQGLERHEPVHNTENAYKCNYCEDSFTSSGKLARHVTSHAGNRPYPCKLCSRTFVLSHHLTRHLRNHYNRKAAQNENGEYKCDVCSMSFRRKDSLINHTAIHSMVNLKCAICNKEFTNAKVVKEHVTTHLAGLPYPCDKCDYSFETQEELEDHEVKHADLEDEEDIILKDEATDMEIIEEMPIKEDIPKIRRSLRPSKIKNYAEFLKLELGYDSEETVDEPEEKTSPKPVKPPTTIQPVIRSDAIKVYKGVKEKHSADKGILEKIPSETITTEENIPSMEESKINKATTKIGTNKKVPEISTKITTVENLGLSKSALEEITDKTGFVEMQIGQKVIRVQKLMMTKAEYQAMSKTGKFEMKGSSIIIDNIKKAASDLSKLTQINALNKNAGKDPITEPPKLSEEKVALNPDLDIQLSKTPVRTYKKKTVRFKEEPQVEIVAIDDDAQKDHVYYNNEIDLCCDETDVSTSIAETDIMEEF